MGEEAGATHILWGWQKLNQIILWFHLKTHYDLSVSCKTYITKTCYKYVKETAKLTPRYVQSKGSNKVVPTIFSVVLTHNNQSLFLSFIEHIYTHLMDIAFISSSLLCRDISENTICTLHGSCQ